MLRYLFYNINLIELGLNVWPGEMFSSHLLLASLAIQVSLARDVPTNIQNFYNSIKNSGSCKNELQTGFYATDGGPNSTSLPFTSFPANFFSFFILRRPPLWLRRRLSPRRLWLTSRHGHRLRRSPKRPRQWRSLRFLKRHPKPNLLHGYRC